MHVSFPVETDIASAKARFAASGGDTALIPAGAYCYRYIEGPLDANGVPTRIMHRCPYWAADPDKPEQAYGYCAFLDAGDWEDGGTILLWDQCKECGINDPYDTIEDAPDRGAPATIKTPPSS